MYDTEEALALLLALRATPVTTRCLTCHALTPQGPRCVLCARTHRRAQNAPRVAASGGSGWGWSRTRTLVLSRDGNRCVLCGTRAIELDIDHIIPLSHGGTSDLNNLRTLCTKCHAKRARK